MAQATSPLLLTPDIQRVLAAVRRRIRLYVWLEGISLALMWLGATFWAALALDYLPVLVGASEMPAAARGVVLAAVAVVLAFILYYWIGRRVLVPLRDHSMALLLERQFGDFRDSLVTAVEMNEQPAHAAEFSPEMLERTAAIARASLKGARPNSIFNYAPLYLRMFLALALMSSIGAFAVLKADTVRQAAERLYLLSDEPWERNAQIEVVGIDVQQPPGPGETSPRVVEVPFVEMRDQWSRPYHVARVARGANVALNVRAALPPQVRFAPESCTIYYRTLRTADGSRGDRGSVVMDGGRDYVSHRYFRYSGKPFKGVLGTLEFDVLGYDHRLRDYRLEVVDSPAIIATRLDLTFPPYMVDVATSNYLPVKDREYLPQGTFIPIGTDVTLKFESNKELKRAEIYNVDAQDEKRKVTVIEIPSRHSDKHRFELPLGKLAGNVSLEISLVDVDNVTTEKPHKVFLTAVEDRPPLVEVKLRGIGTAVTPDVLVPLEGKITDDYAVASSWFSVQLGEEEPRKIDLALGKGGAVTQSLDFRQLRTQETGVAVELAPGGKLFLTVQASDKHDLEGGPHLGAGERYQLDVVTPDELLAILEVREIGLRRRFEQTLDELNQMQDSLLRVKSSLAPDAAAASEPEETDPDARPLSPEEAAQRASELRLLRVQRAIQQSQKSAQETLGIADGFAVIREELINNRIDSQERKERLKEQIADPLRSIAGTEFPRLDQLLGSLAQRLSETRGAGPAAETTAAAEDALSQANDTIAQLEAVLQKMLDLETYNELVDILRDLIRDQETLIDRTKQERKRQALEDLK